MENLYTKVELKQPNIFQRLFKIHPKENALVEINNLLATKPLNEIHIEEIEAISSKYNVNFHKHFSENLKELYQRYLQKCFADNILTEEELNELNSLKHFLALTDNDVNEMHNKLAADIFKKSHDEVISDGNLDQTEDEFIDKLQKNLRLPDDIAKKISYESREQFMNLQVKKIISDRKISPDEWNELTTIAKNLKVQLEFDEATNENLEKFKLYWLIENGELPLKQVDINLQKNEHCYFTINADWMEHRTVTQRINYGGPTFRFKIMKGVYYRAGSVKIQRITSDQLLVIDSGVVYVTNMRLIFMGQKKNSNIKLNKILSVTPYSDGIGIEKESGKSPTLRVLYNSDMFAMILARVINDLQLA